MRKSYIDGQTDFVALTKWCRESSIPIVIRVRRDDGIFTYWLSKPILSTFGDDERFDLFLTIIVRTQDEALVRLWLGGDADAQELY